MIRNGLFENFHRLPFLLECFDHHGQRMARDWNKVEDPLDFMGTIKYLDRVFGGVCDFRQRLREWSCLGPIRQSSFQGRVCSPMSFPVLFSFRAWDTVIDPISKQVIG